MKNEYDFSKAERGKFHNPDAQSELPIYLQDDVMRYLSGRAQARGVELEELVNEVLRKDIALVEAIK